MYEKFTPKYQRKPITYLDKKAYELYSFCRPCDQDKNSVPHIACITCITCTTFNLMVEKKTPRHAIRCSYCALYGLKPFLRLQLPFLRLFCLTNIARYSSKSIHKLMYPNVPSVHLPVPIMNGCLFVSINSKTRNQTPMASESKGDEFMMSTASISWHIDSVL